MVLIEPHTVYGEAEPTGRTAWRVAVPTGVLPPAGTYAATSWWPHTSPLPATAIVSWPPDGPVSSGTGWIDIELGERVADEPARIAVRFDGVFCEPACA